MANRYGAYGWKASRPDPNAVAADPSGLTAKDEVDPRGRMQTPYDQGQLGSCTANAVSGAVEYDEILNGNAKGTPSRLALYYDEREMEGTVSYDSGAYGHDGFKVARKKGLILESQWGYDISRFKDTPPDDSPTYRIRKYVHPGLGRSLDDRVDAFKRLLSNDQTIAFGFTVFESFESEEVAETGIMPVPKKGEQELGGHEPLLVGYLAQYPEHGLVRNSWGTSWGLGGYFLMPWSVLASDQYSGDWRSIYRPASA